jgi:enediyne biosynthesis protein E4
MFHRSRRLAPRVLAALGAALAAAGCSLHPVPTATTAGDGAGGVQLVDVTREAGINFRHQSGASGRLFLPETMGAGCAFLDYDGDSRQDLFLVNSGRLPGFRGKGPFFPALYRNRGDGRFEDVTGKAGLAFQFYGMGCTVGDYDNDGDEDLFITALGSNHLFRNERIPTGQARFVDVTRQAGVAGRGFSTSAAWVDTNCDGDLDLFVCHYAHWSPEINRICPSPVGPSLCRPDTYQGEPSVLYRNNGNATFTDVSIAAGIANRPGKSSGVPVWDYSVGKSLGVAVWDYDRDGWPDLAIANDMEPNQLYRNNRDGTFRDVGVESGMSRSRNGEARGGMGIDTADPLDDGHEAILIGNFSSEGLAFFRESGQGSFTDQADEVGLFRPSLPSVVFGALFCDTDQDGFPDILTANGHVSPHVDRLGGSVTFKQRLALYHNTGPGPAGLPQYVPVG